MDAKDRRIAELDNALGNSKPSLRDSKRTPPMPPSLLCPILSSRRTPKTKTGGVRQKSAEKRTQTKPPPLFTPEQIDATVELKLETCPKCGGELAPTDEPPKKHRQVELVAKPFIVTEYQQAQYRCEACQCHHTAKLPTEVKRAGLFGKNLISHTAYLKGRCHKAHVPTEFSVFISPMQQMHR